MLRRPSAASAAVAVLVLTVVVGAVMAAVLPAIPVHAAPAPLTVRIGLAWDRWAAECSGMPVRGIQAVATAAGARLWPTETNPGTSAPSPAGEPPPAATYVVSTASSNVVLAAADSRWLAGAAGACAERMSRAMGQETPLPGRVVTAQKGPSWYVVLDPATLASGPSPSIVASITAAGWPSALVPWPTAPGHPNLARTGLCAVALSGAQAGLIYPATSPVSIQQFAAGAGLAHAGRPYRGRLELLTAGDARLLSVVNHVDIEDYLLGVVPSEMPSSWPLEALKAQAVAARTYTVSNLGRHGSRGFDLCFDIHCQAYGGIDTERSGPSTAVRQTAGIVATYGGRLINAVYHAHAGGATDSSQVIWSAAEPYLVGTSRTYEQPYYWTATNTRLEVQGAISSALGGNVASGVFPVLRLTPRDFTTGGRALRVDVFGPAASARITAGSLRGALGSYRLRSGSFRADQVWTAALWPDWATHGGFAAAIPVVTWAPGSHGRGQGLVIWQQPVAAGAGVASGTPEGAAQLYAPAAAWIDAAYYVFSGEGFGHGVGMSQWGAREMAALGFGYRDILTNFYRGATLAANYGR